ncbi:MAG: hypothetical protein CMJ19_13895 [Phycisphaeraceae bacterium]|nr:hypothetical protein [Phycisphaeraceae bacterium]
MANVKYTKVVRLIERRLQHGDYALGGLPGEERLAIEAGVSRMTVRRALDHLEGEGILNQQTNGRRTVNWDRLGLERTVRVAFLAPAYDSTIVNHLRIATSRTVDECGGMLRPVDYVHWDDPVVLDVFQAFDGVFLVSQAQKMPERVMKNLEDQAHRVVMLDTDMSELGIPSINCFPYVFIQRMLDKLGELGHTHVDCFNTQPYTQVIEKRIWQWELWKSTHQATGELINEPVQAYKNAADHAYEVMMGRLRSGYRPSALICLTEHAALGVYAALYDHGLKVGQNVSLITIGEGAGGDFLRPSLYSLKYTDPSPFIRIAYQWMADQDQNHRWRGPLLMQPPEPQFFEGSSIGPPLAMEV